MSNVLFTMPGYDPVTWHFQYWADKALSHVNTSTNMQPIVLRDDEAHRARFEAVIAKYRPELILLNGHGNEDAVFGHNDDVLASVDDGMHKKFNGAIVHSLACSSGRILGREMVSMGAAAFIGYDDLFRFYYRNDNPAIEGHDDLAALYLEPAYTPMLSLSSGKSANSAFNDARRLYKHNILSALATNMDSDVVQVLTDNLKRLVMHGDASAAVTT